MSAERGAAGTSTTLDIPFNTMLADLDATLRGLLERELTRHGFGGVKVAFDAPTRDWAATLSAPTLSLFLYDLGESAAERHAEWLPRELGGSVREVRPPLRLRASYALSVFTRGIDDEHRLLSQAIGVLYAHPTLPAGLLRGTLAEHCGDEPPGITVGHGAAERRADFWTAVGGQYKPSVDISIVVPVPSGRMLLRGPQVHATVVRAGAGAVREERHQIVGRVLGADGEPATQCRILLPEAGRATVTDTRGEFRIDGVMPGTHRCLAVADDGAQAERSITPPGAPLELQLRRSIHAPTGSTT